MRKIHDSPDDGRALRRSPGGEALHRLEKKMNDVAPRDRGIAMVFQNYALYPHMTVETKHRPTD